MKPKEILKQYGINATLQRIIVLEYLHNTDSHPSVEKIYNDLQEKYPSITLSTIYNIVELFAKKGIIRKIYTPNGPARYDGRIDPHFHIYNEDTNEIYDIADDELDRYLQNYIQNKLKDYPIHDYQLIFNIKPKEYTNSKNN